MDIINLQNFFTYFDEKNPKHVAAVAELQKEINSLKPELLTNNTNWVRIYRTPVERPKPDSVVPFYPQTDNYTQPDRTCNSSSCAMCLEYYKPGSLPPGPKGDDAYLKKVLALGDSTDHDVQTKVLKSYGLNSEFSYNLSFTDLDREINAKRPMVIGILHRGPLSNPSGGHMIVVHTKLNNGNYVCHDPYGDLYDGYVSDVNNGKNVIYEASVLKARWTVKGSGGWGRIFKP